MDGEGSSTNESSSSSDGSENFLFVLCSCCNDQLICSVEFVCGSDILLYTLFDHCISVCQMYTLFILESFELYCA